ncbi:hypothetical protein PROFUN_04986 [Planoprotostelium fungivorum]|uniref:Uncharacterized protein n=1 Tax=Planoprotostelium fungivorum TaxID=1890364 RepID=A0A2P6NSS0_9EUKA|nr:hypothetical protein PROFUN_04986 [Planoprotostelium fungivorum]
MPLDDVHRIAYDSRPKIVYDSQNDSGCFYHPASSPDHTEREDRNGSVREGSDPSSPPLALLVGLVLHPAVGATRSATLELLSCCPLN